VAGDDPNEVIMQAAWARLWKVATKYYLPSIIVDGAQGNGIVVDPLGRLVIADTGTIPLYQSDTWGSVSVELTEGLVGGLDTLANGGMTYDPQSGAFSATVSIGCLTFGGNYAVSADGAVGCAIDSAAILLKGVSPPGPAIASAAAGIGDQSDLDLAVGYRDQLVGFDNGLDLVSTYYDNNETLDYIVSNDTLFQQAWTLYETAGQGTAYYAQQTATAAANPHDSAAIVGDENYRFHAAYMRATLFKRVVYYQGQGDPDGRYQALATAIIGFKGQTDPYTQPMTAGQVMEQVAKPTPPTRADGARGEDSVEARAERQAELDEPMWEERARALEAERAASETAAPTPVKGHFDDSVAVASVTIDGSVAVTGTPPNTSLLVSLAGLTADVPPIAIELQGDSKLLSETQNAIARSSWFQQLLAKKIKDELGSQTVLSYLSNRVNQAITQALGPT
jgi:hypothetical protein